MELNANAVKALLDAFDQSDWQEMTVTVGSDTLHVSRQAPADTAPSTAGAPLAAPAPADASGKDTGAPAPAAPAAAGAAPQAAPEAAPVAVAAADPATNGGGPAEPAAAGSPGEGTVVSSPSVGLFWRAPSPGAPPFVEVGSTVSAGDTVAIVEVMKLMNHVAAPVDGVVTSILVENGATVEYGQPLVTIDPAG